MVDPGSANPWLLSGTGSALDLVEVGDQAILKIGVGSYKMLYECITSGNLDRTCLATSPATLGPWTKYGGQNTPKAVLDTGPTGSWDHAQVAVGNNGLFFDGTIWHYFYDGSPTVGTATRYQIGRAYTTDTTWQTWTKDAGNPVLPAGRFGSFDSVDVIVDGVNLVAGTYYLFYSGFSASSVYQLGYATSSAITGPWTKYSGNPVMNDSTVPGAVVWDPSTALFFHWYSSATTFYFATSPDGHTWTQRGSVFSGPNSACAAGGIVGDATSAVREDGIWLISGHCYTALANGGRNAGFVTTPDVQ